MSWFSNQSDWEMKMCWASALRCFVQRVERTGCRWQTCQQHVTTTPGWIGFVIEWCAAGCCCKSVAGAYTHTSQYTCNILGMVTFKTQVTNLSGRKLSYFSVFAFVLLLFFFLCSEKWLIWLSDTQVCLKRIGKGMNMYLLENTNYTGGIAAEL